MLHLKWLFQRRDARQTAEAALAETAMIERFMKRLADTEPENRYPLQVSFYERLLQAAVLLPVPEKNDCNAAMPLMALINADEKKGIPVFTSAEALARWVENPTGFAQVRFQTLCQCALEADADFLILNIAGPACFEIPRMELVYLAEGLIPPPRTRQPLEAASAPIHREVTITVGEENRLPSDLQSRLECLFTQHPAGVQRAYAFSISYGEASRRWRPALGIALAEELAPAWEKSIRNHVFALLEEMLDMDELVNVFFFKYWPGLEESVAEKTQPFYRIKAERKVS